MYNVQCTNLDHYSLASKKGDARCRLVGRVPDTKLAVTVVAPRVDLIQMTVRFVAKHKEIFPVESEN